MKIHRWELFTGSTSSRGVDPEAMRLEVRNKENRAHSLYLSYSETGDLLLSVYERVPDKQCALWRLIRDEVFSL